ncbi:MAG: hypothetical protein ACW98Y_17860, partial [Candidatus Thorarchaeota archaeon]
MNRSGPSFLVFSTVLVILLFTTSALGFPSQNGSCTTSGCHDNSSGMTITSSGTSFNVETDATFSVTIQVVGVSGQDALLLKFPSGVSDNAEFSYTDLDAEGSVNDGDTADLDADTDEVEVNYELTSPSIPGSYTLEAYAAQHTPNGISVSLSVIVA